jgi:rhamnose transport system ATP-binding protein
MLRLTGITKTFGGVQALKGVSFDLRAGEVHALVGENGAGKSTLIKVITGAHRPDEGTMEVNGQVVEDLDPVTARTLGIAAIYQQPALFPDLTVAENIAIGLELGGSWRRVRWGERHDRARRLLDRAGAAIDPDADVHRLSMPEQQLVEIARALGAEARILIMDEPTASLSDQEVERLFRVIAELKSRGVGIIYISHRLEELPRIADRVTALRDGVLVGTRPMSEVTRAELIRMMVGRELSAVFPKVAAEPGEVVLEVTGLGCQSSGVHNVDLSVRAGEVVGLAGLVGAGRTELARALFGLTPADSGEVRLNGQSVVVDSPGRAVAMGIAYVPEDRRRHGVILDMSTAANTTLATLQAHARLGLLDGRRERATAEQFVRRLGIKTPTIETPVGNLSGGNQQKVALARWLTASPRLLILDEPTQGVDVGAKAEIHRLMSDLAGQGMAILMISSELPEILGMSDRIAVMYGGTIVAFMDRAGATQEKILDRALGHGLDDHEAAVVFGEAEKTNHEKHEITRKKSDGSEPWEEMVGRPLREPDDGSSLSPFRVISSFSWLHSLISRYRRELSVTLAFVVLLLLLAAVAPRFFRADQLRPLVVANAPVLVAAVGMTLVILCRQIDISIGSIFSICGVVAGLLSRSGLPMMMVGLGTLAAGGAFGAVNGSLVAGLGLPSIVVTLATLMIGRESLRYLREGEFVRDLPPSFQWFGAGQSAGQWLVVAIALATLGGFAWGLRYLAAGRAVYATGSDPEAARLAGIRPRRVTFAVFVVMGALAGLAALLNAVRLPDVDPNSGTGLELQVIAAVVVGGVAISGGRGTLAGALVGVALLGSIGPALFFLGTKPQWEKAIQGLIILLAVASDALYRERNGSV